MERLKDDRCASGGVVIVTHVVSSRGSGVSLDDSWFHSEKRHAAQRESERERKRSDLHLWIFMILVHTDFSPHFLWFFRRGVSTLWPTHTHRLTDKHTWGFTDTFRYSHMHSLSPRGTIWGEKEIKKGNKSSLEWKVVNVAKSKKKYIRHKRRFKKQTYTHTLTHRPHAGKCRCWALKHSGNEAPFKANEAALAAYESTIGKPPSSAAGWCVCVDVCVSVSRIGRGKNGQYLAGSTLRFSSALSSSFPRPVTLQSSVFSANTEEVSQTHLKSYHFTQW